MRCIIFQCECPWDGTGSVCRHSKLQALLLSLAPLLSELPGRCLQRSLGASTVRWVSLATSQSGNRVGESGGKSFLPRWQRHRVPAGAEGIANPTGSTWGEHAGASGSRRASRQHVRHRGAVQPAPRPAELGSSQVRADRSFPLGLVVVWG